ncbi:3-hydroxyisobutyrate dehydrogenase [Fictibacillus solisalsi]|uniref:3-hydroxyisobutyrate dehydrogenase n=1 Tax=Fictibacillus solisalsi TaxID=459525 RepID=A0A1G9U3U7_9BACL|nr:NAD(P)-dependent oxidoreductase [Fictibacillus solisalsi]SDM54334.1 3-hydroxyisobutyrate dehydrogenase [Fictibacillus solisalsi]
MIGFIGLGIMGSRMAANLLSAGNELVVYNRTKEKALDLLDKGAVWGESPAETARQSTVLFTMLTNPKAVERVALGDEGFLQHLPKNSIWVDCSTVNPGFSRQMADEARQFDIRFLDAPVAGSLKPAEDGELVFHVGGEAGVLEEVRPYLNVLGKAIHHQGEHGSGTAMKLVVNLTLAQSMAVFAEALNFGESLGLEKETILNTLIGGPTTGAFIGGKKNKLLTNQYDTEFPLEHIQKDLNLIAGEAYQNGSSLPIANVTKEMYSLANQYGLGKEDFSAIYEFLRTPHK